MSDALIDLLTAVGVVVGYLALVCVGGRIIHHGTQFDGDGENVDKATRPENRKN